MARVERVREILTGPLNLTNLEEKSSRGWRLVALEWEREKAEGAGVSPVLEADVPFGLRVADDCLHLEENPAEREVLMEMMELIVRDLPLSRVAEELNGKGYRTRQGNRWSAISAFHLLPRLIEAGPRVLSSEEWVIRRQHIYHAVDPDARPRPTA